MSAVWAWMSRPDVVLWVSVTAIALNIIGFVAAAVMECRRG